MTASLNSSGAGEGTEGRPTGESERVGQGVESPDELAFLLAGADDSEPVRFADEIARRTDETIFLTRTAELAEALRDWGLLAVTRPESGRWCEAACEAIEDRDVVFIEVASDDGDDWTRADMRVIGLVVGRIGFISPRTFSAWEPCDDPVAFVNDQRARGIAPWRLTFLAKQTLLNVRDLVADGKPKPAPDWPPLRYGKPPESVPFPVDVFPEPVARFVWAVAEAVGAPADFAGLAALVTAGAAIGRSVILELKPGYLVSPALFGLNVGAPSSGTSPSLAAVVHPLRALDEALERLHREEVDQYERVVKQAKEEKKDRPPAPELRSALLEDVAFDTVVAHLSRSPGGLLVTCDEAAPWVASLDRGAERRLWFSALRGLPLRIDCKRAGANALPTRLDGPFLAFCGNLSPGALKGIGDGLWERVLFAFPEAEPCRHWSGRGLPDEVRAAWADAIDGLYGPTSTKAAAIVPRVVALAPDAQEEWARWYDTQVDDLNEPDADAAARAMDGKLCDFTARLALILHGLDTACHPALGARAPLAAVSRSALVRAVRLGAYFRVHQRRARCAAGDTRVDGTAGAIVDWARRTGRTQFSVGTLKDSLRWLAQRPGELAGALDWLEQRGAVSRQAPTPSASRRGRPPSAVYAVHPELRAQAPREIRKNGVGA